MNLELWKARLLALRPMLLRALLYPVVFGFFFVTFVYFTFPYDRLAELIVAQAEAPRTTRTGVQPSGIELAIGSLEPTFLPGLEARDVAVTFLPQPATPGAPLPTGEGAPRPVVMRLDKLRVRLSMLPLLWGRANVSFSLQGMQGEAEGSASMLLRAPAPEAPTTPPRAGAAPTAAPEGPVVTDLEVTTRDLDLGQLGPVVQAVGLPLGGRMSGTLRMEVPDGRASQATGEIRFAVDRMTVGDGRAQYQIPGFGGVTIEQIRAGRLDLNIVARTGVLTFERTAAHSPEFDLALDGRVGLRPVLSESGLDLGVRFRLTDVYRNKSEQAGRILTVMEMAPDLRRARRPDGMIAFRCIGTFSRAPRCLPDGRGMGANGGAAPTGMPAGMAP